MTPKGFVTAEATRRALHKLFQGDVEADPLAALRLALSDDLKPTDSKGRWKPSPLLLLSALFAGGLVGIFLYFTISSR